jgi:hypothetical protein
MCDLAFVFQKFNGVLPILMMSCGLNRKMNHHWSLTTNRCLIPKMNSLRENSFRLNRLKNSWLVHCFRWNCAKEYSCCSNGQVQVNCCAEEQDLLMGVRVAVCCCVVPGRCRSDAKCQSLYCLAANTLGCYHRVAHF